MSSMNSELTLFSGVPLDNKYENTFTSTSLIYSSAQHTAYPDQNLYYIRYDKNIVEITHSNMKVNGVNLYACNYMAFKNPNYENKVFYCFITNVSYINDSVAKLEFEVDVMMTWLISGDLVFEECLIERKHTDDDVIGKYILDEPIEVGDYVYKLERKTDMNLNICAGVTATWDDNESKWKAGSSNSYYEGGLYVCDGVARYRFTDTGAQIQTTGIHQFGSLSALLVSLRTDADDGQAKYLSFIYYYPSLEGNANPNPIITRADGIGENLNYKPKNNKLWCFPYYTACVNNYEGAIIDTPFEFSTHTNSNVITYQLRSTIADAVASIEPINYRSDGKCYLVTKTKFPVMSSSANEYATYQAQLKSSMIPDLVTNVAVPATTGALFGSAAGGAGGVIGGVIGGVGGLINYAMKAWGGAEQSKLGVVSVGNNSGFITAKNDTIQFGIYHKTIRKNYAESIDAFFTKFGYKVNTIETPKTTNGRNLNWHYTKTIGCAVKGANNKGAPTQAISKIEDIMDNGITFWKIADIGNYAFPSS